MRHKQTAVEKDAEILEAMKMQAFSLPVQLLINKKNTENKKLEVTSPKARPIHLPSPR